jgi:hypothetical protein
VEDPAKWDSAKVLGAYTAAVDKGRATSGKIVNKKCTTTIKKPLDGDPNLVKLLGISVFGFDVQNTVCSFLGEGTSEYNDQTVKESLQKCTLTTADLTSAKASRDAKGNLVLEIGVKGGTNPTKMDDGGMVSPMGKFTWDYENEKSTRAAIVGAENDVPGLHINIQTIKATYSDVKIKAVIAPDGRFVTMNHSYKYTARVEGVEVKEIFITVGKGEWGQGNATGNIDYTFKY